jgi:hypothetical protein
MARTTSSQAAETPISKGQGMVGIVYWARRSACAACRNPEGNLRRTVWSLGIGCSMLEGHLGTIRLQLGTGFCVLKSRHTIFLRWCDF